MTHVTADFFCHTDHFVSLKFLLRKKEIKKIHFQRAENRKEVEKYT